MAAFKSMYSIWAKACGGRKTDLGQVYDTYPFAVYRPSSRSRSRTVTRALGFVPSDVAGPVPRPGSRTTSPCRSRIFYQFAAHPTVVAEERGRPFEVQIPDAGRWISSASRASPRNWKYKEGRVGGEQRRQELPLAPAGSSSSSRRSRDPRLFLHSLKIDHLPRRGSTPSRRRGMVFAFPGGGANPPLDFAYRIHTDVRTQMPSGRGVNGKLVPLRDDVEERRTSSTSLSGRDTDAEPASGLKHRGSTSAGAAQDPALAEHRAEASARSKFGRKLIEKEAEAVQGAVAETRRRERARRACFSEAWAGAAR